MRANLGTIRTELGRFGRQVSGYSLEHLLPENGFSRPVMIGIALVYAATATWYALADRRVTGEETRPGRAPRLRATR